MSAPCPTCGSHSDAWKVDFPADEVAKMRAQARQEGYAQALKDVREELHRDWATFAPGEFPSGALAWAGGVLDCIEKGGEETP